MKTLLLSVAIFFCALFTAFSQNMQGIYTNTWVSSDKESLSYTLSLKEDGSFIFESFRTYIGTPDIITKAQGTWKHHGVLLELTTEVTNGEENSLAAELNNTKARFVSLSPRHPDFNLVKPTLEFTKSEVFYAQGMELRKQDSKVSSME